VNKKAVQVLAFDYGEKRIGVAIGQSITHSANPLHPLAAKNGEPDWQTVQNLLDEWQPDLVVVGCPLNMDDTEQRLTKRARKFANRVHGRFGKQVDMVDERLSSVAAKDELFEQFGYKGLQQQSIDSLAACHILETWFREHPTD
jgi:putative Holliday junction resolvase